MSSYVCHSMEAVRAAISVEMQNAMREVVDKSQNDIDVSLGEYYTGAPKLYIRTGALADSQRPPVSGGGGEFFYAIFELDQYYSYAKQGIPTSAIFDLAEAGSLVGSGGFWANSESRIESNVNSIFSAHF